MNTDRTSIVLTERKCQILLSIKRIKNNDSPTSIFKTENYLALELTKMEEAMNSKIKKLATNDSIKKAISMAGTVPPSHYQQTAIKIRDFTVWLTAVCGSGEFSIENLEKIGYKIVKEGSLSSLNTQSYERYLSNVKQGLMSGYFTKDELRPILETSPRLSQALQKIIDVNSAGDLIKHSEITPILSDQFLSAVQSLPLENQSKA